MRLLYIYVNDYANDIELNFSNEYIFSYDKLKLTVKKNKTYNALFFGANVADILALVGKNGAGKTTILENITSALSNDFYAESLIVYLKDGKYFIDTNIKSVVIDSQYFDIQANSPAKVKTIYYSNTVDISKKFSFKGNYLNTSTKKILSEKNFKSKEMEKQIEFSLAFKKEINQYINLPSEVIVELSDDLLSESSFHLYLEETEKRLAYFRNEKKKLQLEEKSLLLQYNDLKNAGNSRLEKLDRLIKSIQVNIKLIDEKISKEERVSSLFYDLFDIVQEIVEIEVDYSDKNARAFLSIIYSHVYMNFIHSLFVNIPGYSIWKNDVSNPFSKEMNIELEFVGDQVEIFMSFGTQFLENLSENLSEKINEYWESVEKKLTTNSAKEGLFFNEYQNIEGIEVVIEETLKKNVRIETPIDGETNFNMSQTIILDLILSIVNKEKEKTEQDILFLEILGEKSKCRNDMILEIDDEVESLLIELKKNRFGTLFSYSWHDLSSGEYALLSIFSRFPKQEDITEENIVLIIDEGELYFHPELQIKFINILITMLKKMYFKKTIQIILATHSPFIISDLPRTSVYLIIKNNQVNTVKNNMVDETFGGNIFDILKNPFFIENGIVGEFSKIK